MPTSADRRGPARWARAGALLVAAIVLLSSRAPVAADSASKDLVPSIRRAMRGFMVRCPEPVEGHPGILRTTFGCSGLPVPQVGHAQWDWGDCTGRSVEAWLYAREATGDRAFGREVEEGQRAALLWLLTPDLGMPCVPEHSDPARGLYHYQMWDQGRTLRALVRWWVAEKRPGVRADLRERIALMARSLRGLATRGTDPRFGAYAVYPWDCRTGDETGDDLLCMRGGQLIEPLALYYGATGDEFARLFASELTAGVLSGHEADTYEGPTKRLFTFGEDGSFGGHFHDHASIALGIARFGRALYERGATDEGRELILWAKRVYDWTISPGNVNAGSSWGWFPENVGHDNTQAREICEVCCAADMIEFAAALAEVATLDPAFAGFDALWDHVERYTLNSIVPAQFSVTPRYRRLVEESLAASSTVRNGYVEFSTDANGCFSHEAAGFQTLRVADGGHLSQSAYGVSYAGKSAWFGYAGGRPMEPHGFVGVRPCAPDGEGALAGSVRTEDAMLEVGVKVRCGEGPSVRCEFTIANRAAAPLADVAFSYVANLDYPNYSADLASVREDGRIVVRSASGPGRLGMVGEPAGGLASVGDAIALLTGLSQPGLGAPATEATGNVAGGIGWSLGTLAPGEQRVVAVTLAAATDDAQLAAALGGAHFDSRTVAEQDERWLADASRMEGAFVAAFVPNDLAFLGADGRPYMNMMGCCFPAGVRGLYACWEAALSDDGTTLSSRLPLDRLHAVARQEVREARGVVTQTIRLSSPRRVRLRAPDWAPLESVEVRDGRGARVPFEVEGRWLALKRLRASASLSIRYPLIARETRERVGGSLESLGFAPADRRTTYTARWLGNRVVDLTPRGALLPVFE